jgi:hypothetical protein
MAAPTVYVRDFDIIRDISERNIAARKFIFQVAKDFASHDRVLATGPVFGGPAGRSAVPRHAHELCCHRKKISWCCPRQAGKQPTLNGSAAAEY